MYILGISALYHDSAAALIHNGAIIAAAQEERFTRIKHDAAFPVNAVEYCIQEAGIAPCQLDAIVYYDNPLLTLDRWIHNVLALKNDSSVLIDKSFDPIFAKRLWIRKLTEETLEGAGKHGVFLATRHHIAHAASAFYPSPFDRAAILTLDGVGEWATTTIGVGRDGVVSSLKEIEYPHSLGLLYSAFTYYCGFKVNSGDYKLMGLAPYGRPVYENLIRKHLITLKDDGSFRLNMKYFDFHRNTVMTNQTFADLFGAPPRLPETTITRREMDVAASAQKVLEDAVLLLAREARRLTGEKHLVMAGGVALNCVANGKLKRANIFDEIWVQPAAGDAGGALGAALYAAHAHFRIPRPREKNVQGGSLFGPVFTSEKIQAELDKQGAAYRRYAKSELYPKVAKMLADGQIVGFFNGRMEFGPRALGARSILADPRNPDTQTRLNLKIKFRESFRPFAPAVLEEKASSYFEMDFPSPYMLFCAPVKKERCLPFDLETRMRDESENLLPIVRQARSDIPAITHVDYSARVQTVNRTDNPDFHDLISCFDKLTGCPVLVNTSFNVRGEPIVCTPHDAWLCFRRTDMDALVLGEYLLLKNEQPSFEDVDNWRQQYALD